MIRNIRKQRRLTLEMLAKMSGVSRVSINRYELNKREPKLSDAMKIARALGVTVEELMGDDLPEIPERNMMVSAETR